MKVVNRRGRVLLEVTRADVVNRHLDLNGRTVADLVYTYKGPGIGGYGPLLQLHRTIHTIQADCPSAKVVGLLPEPTNYSGEQL